MEDIFSDGLGKRKVEMERDTIHGFQTWPQKLQVFGRKLLSSLTEAFGVMVFEEGFFHADPHPGNIFIRRCDSFFWAWKLMKQKRIGHVPNE